MTATCTNCKTTFHHVDPNEDGSPAIENARCAHPGCQVYLCRAGWEHLSFVCESCNRRFCADHKVVLDCWPYCANCAAVEVESREPECECRQTDTDLFDAGGCPRHDRNSRRNVRLRAVTAIQQYDFNGEKEIA